MDKNDKIAKVMELFSPSLLYPFDNFFDLNSENLLDEKIEVLTALKDGKAISEIPNFYDILELYPKKDVHWD